MRQTIDGPTNSENSNVFLAENAETFQVSIILQFMDGLANQLERVIPQSDFEQENGYNYLAESMFSSLLDIFQKPVTMLENQSDKAIVAMRDARDTGNGLRATQALDRYKIAQARLIRFESVLARLVDEYQSLIGDDYQTPQARAKAYSILADKKLELMSEIDKLIG